MRSKEIDNSADIIDSRDTVDLADEDIRRIREHVIATAIENASKP